MIDVTINELLNMAPVLQEISHITLPGAAALKVARLMREINNELKTIEETRNKILNKYAEMENGQLKVYEDNTIRIRQEFISVYQEEITELMMTHITINAELLDDSCFESITITPQQLLDIEKIIKK